MIGSDLRAAYPSCSDPLASSLVTGNWKYDLSNYIFFSKNKYEKIRETGNIIFSQRIPHQNKHSPCLCSFSHSSSDEDDSEEEDQSHSEIASLKRLPGLVPSSIFFSINILSELPALPFQLFKNPQILFYLHLHKNLLRLTCHFECPCRYGGRGEETGENTDNKNWRVAFTDSGAAFSLGQLTT